MADILAVDWNLIIFDVENFMADILAVDWNLIIFANANLVFYRFHDTVNQIIDKYMPLKKLTNKEYKRKFQPWITNRILKSISVII